MLPAKFKPEFGKLWKRLQAEVDGFNRDFLGESFSGDVFERTVDRIGDELDLPGGERRGNVRSMLSAYYGQEVTPSLRQSIAWRIAGGYDRLKDGERLAPAFEKVEPFWTGLSIEDVRFGRPSQTGKTRYDVSLRIHSGLFAGLRFVDAMPTKWVRYKLAREIGFPKYKSMHQLELVGCVLIGRIEVEDPLRPKLMEFDVNSSVKNQNSMLRRKRRLPCVRNFDWPCHACPIGHSYAPPPEVPCHRATHSHTYVKRFCTRCEQDSYFDPEGNSQYICLSCQGAESRFKERITVNQ